MYVSILLTIAAIGGGDFGLAALLVNLEIEPTWIVVALLVYSIAIIIAIIAIRRWLRKRV
jgi:divalent metal cation (Fe/Co/Zn/Cd) transporter